MPSYDTKRHGAQFEFVLGSADSTCRRHTELQASTNRSHAAKVSHARRKEQLERRQWASLGVSYEEVQQRKSTVPSGYGSALPPLFAGNSDPFSSTALPVTPHINLIMSFFRDAVCPALYGTPFYRKVSADGSVCMDLSRPCNIISSRAAVRAWQQAACSLSDEGMALALLAPWCDVLPQFLGELPKKWKLTTSLEMRTRSVKLLREKLAASEGSLRYNRPALLHIFCLSHAELFAGNFDAVGVHARMLRATVEDAFLHGTIDLFILIQFLFIDVDAAVKNMQRTIFDVDGWFLKVLAQPWAMVKSLFPPLESEKLIISPTMQAEPLVSAMTEIRYAFRFLNRPFGPGDCYDGSPSDLLFGMISSRSFVDLGRLINLYLSLTSPVEEAWSSLTTGQKYTQACLALSVVFVIRSVAHTGYIQNIDIRDASATLMSQLKPLISQTLKTCTSEELTVYGEAHLWILYVTALYDQRVQNSGDARLACASPEADDDNINTLLANQARKEKVSTWNEMRNIESRFVQTDLLQPSGETWFEETINGKIWLTWSEDSGYVSSMRKVTWNPVTLHDGYALA